MIFQSEKGSSARSESVSRPHDSSRKKVQHSMICSDLKITGDLESTGDITIEGSVDGKIKCRTLTLGENPVLNSSVEADTVRICGTFSGDVRARKVVLTKNAKVTGDIYHESLEVEEGAHLEGRLGRLKVKKANDDTKVTSLKPVETEPVDDADDDAKVVKAKSAGTEAADTKAAGTKAAGSGED